MIKFHTIGQIEHEYHFEDAVASADTFNGAFGAVSTGKFTAGATATKAIMQVEVGDDAGIPKYAIAKDSHVKVIDFTKYDGELFDIFDYPLPASVKVGDKVQSQEDGSLHVNSAAEASAFYLEVKEIIGNKAGVVVLVHGATA